MDRETFKQNAKKNIDEIYAEIRNIQEKIKKAEGATKAKYEEKVADLKSKMKDLQPKYDALANATDEKWEEVKKAFSPALESIKEGLNKLTSVFK